MYVWVCFLLFHSPWEVKIGGVEIVHGKVHWGFCLSEGGIGWFCPGGVSPNENHIGWEIQFWVAKFFFGVFNVVSGGGHFLGVVSSSSLFSSESGDQ